nr:hypothetical protein [Tanacetum cinerariifolium]
MSLVDTSVSKEVAYNVIPPPKLLLRRGPLLMFRARPLLLKNPRTRRSQFCEGFDADFVFYFQCTPCCRQDKMDGPDLTMEEYIKLEAEKLIGFPAIVYNHALTFGSEIPSEPTVRPLDNNEIDFRMSFDESDDEDYIFIYEKSSFSYKLTYVNDLKIDSEKDIDEVNLPHNDVVIEQLDNNIDYNVDTQSHEFDENFKTNHDIHSEPFDMEGYLIIIKVMIQMRFHEGMPLNFIIKDLYVPFGILFDPKRFYKDGISTKKLRRL